MADHSDLRALFRNHDTNGDGKLDLQEMLPLLRDMHKGLPDAELKAIFNRANLEKGQALSYKGFVDFMTKPIMEHDNSESKRESKKPSQNREVAKAKPADSSENAWATVVPLPKAYQSRGCQIDNTEERGINLAQLQDLATLAQAVVAKSVVKDLRTKQRVGWDEVNMYHLDPTIVRPVTAPFNCSFVEVAASGPQAPCWFVSHWWGTPFQQSLSLLRFHARERQAGDESPYWICTFANNQHDLSELAGSLNDTPFVKAILSPTCVGTVTLLDYEVNTLRRMWCVLETFVSTTWAKDNSQKERAEHFYDIAAWLPSGSGTFGGKPVPAKPSLLLDCGSGRTKEAVLDPESGGAFPLTVSRQGVLIDVYKAEASRKSDRRNILHLIAGTPQERWEVDAPPESCDAYEKLNERSRSLFAPGAIYAAALRNDVSELEELLSTYGSFKDTGICDGATALYAAAWKKNMESMAALLAANADANVGKEDGATPLFIAAQKGHSEVITELIRGRADPDVARTDGVPPLLMAVQNKHEGAVLALLTGKANTTPQTPQGKSPLQWASQQGLLGIVKALLQHQADPNQEGQVGGPPLRLASSNKIVQALLAARADPDNGSAGGRRGNALPAMARAFESLSGKASEGEELLAAIPKAAARPRAASKGKAKAAPRRLPALPGGIMDMYADLDGGAGADPMGRNVTGASSSSAARGGRAHSNSRGVRSR
mmetsp:Transcript_15843/g.28899  ORF Transcript_15843/g.28899 Transcript_15843/m.28899 type:complete len:716 (+) Transcript_15843:27-2174(+)